MSRLHISAILLVAAVVWGACLILAGVPVVASWLRPFSIVVGVLVLVLSIAERWLWRLRWLQPWLFDMPNLNGTWKATIHPSAPGQAHEQVVAYMAIRQTLSTVSLRLFSSESESETLSARVVRCEDGSFRLAAVYSNTPRLEVRQRSSVHHGAFLLSVQGDPPVSLAGQYWTDRLSLGDLVLAERRPHQAGSFSQGAEQ